MKPLTLLLLLTLTAAADDFRGPPGARGGSRESRESSDSYDTRDSREDTDWTRVSNPPSVPEPGSPGVLLAVAGAVLLSRRTRTQKHGRWVRERRVDVRTVRYL
jgi:hypothetical protein